MANSAAKKQATNNTQALKQLHLASLAVNAFVLFGYFVLGRPSSLKPVILFSIPAVFLQWQLERSSRPKFDSKGQLVHPGEDMAQKGMTEWFHDVIYLTWGCDIMAVLLNSSKIWYAILAIPGYAAVMIYTNFIKPWRQSGASKDPAAGAAPESQSKRQEKLAKRGNVKYTR